MSKKYFIIMLQKLGLKQKRSLILLNIIVMDIALVDH